MQPRPNAAAVVAGHGLCAGRGARQPPEGTDRPPGQTGGLFRRQDPDHRLCAVECAELGHPQDGDCHAVQGAQPDPPHAARLELLPGRAQRISGHPARQPAGGREATGIWARPMPWRRTSTSSTATASSMSIILAGDHIYKMDYEVMLRQHVDSRRRCDHRLPDRAADGGDGLWRDACRQGHADHRLSWKSPKDPPSIPGDPDHALASMGIYVFDWAFLRDLLIRDMPRTPIPATISAMT